MDRISICGLVDRTVSLDRTDLAQFPEHQVVPDVAALQPGKSGRAIYLRALLERAGLDPRGKRLVIHSPRDDYQVETALDDVVERALIIFEREGRALSRDEGGPFRFFVPHAAACGTATVDACGNVKGVERLEVCDAD